VKGFRPFLAILRGQHLALTHRAMREGFLVIAAVCLAGCPNPQDPSTPDSNVNLDSTNEDGNSSDSKLRIEWETNPVIPGTTPLGHRLDDVRFRMEKLKATVDVDPNDPNITREELKLRWTSEEGPEPLTFSDAPAGRYTSIVLKLDEGDNEDSFEFRGVTNTGDTFELEDKATISISMTCNFVLLPGETKTLVVDIDLAPAVDAIDLEQLEAGEGVDHHLDDDNVAVLTQLRTAMQAAFSVREK
jgi:hypothetical protein